jgi:hypothetical protein
MANTFEPTPEQQRFMLAGGDVPESIKKLLQAA